MSAEPKPKRVRGTGSVYRLKGRETWWIKYPLGDGSQIRESAGSAKESDAKNLLKHRLQEVNRGSFVAPDVRKVHVSDLIEEVKRDYRINGRKSLDDLEARWKLHLLPFFGHLRAVAVDNALCNRYVDERQQAGAANATINRELAILKRALKLALKQKKISVIPVIDMLKENNTRTGFLETKQHDALAVECAKFGLWLRAMFEVGYTYGWRHSEILALKVRQVDLLNGTIRLEPGTTKNGEGREVTMTAPVRELLTHCIIGKSPEDPVFTRDKKPVRDFRGAWESVCQKAGVPGLLFHDLRRTAARNLRRAGVAETVIMKIGGWLTNEMFRRYAIVCDSDLSDAMDRLEVSQRSEKAQQLAQDATQPEFGHHLGIINQKHSDQRASLPVPSHEAN
jgi:integrase